MINVHIGLKERRALYRIALSFSILLIFLSQAFSYMNYKSKLPLNAIHMSLFFLGYFLLFIAFAQKAHPDTPSLVPRWLKFSSKPPHRVYYYFLALLILQYWLVFLFPSGELDAMTSYLARFKQETFGPLYKTAIYTTSLTFPRWFDSIQYYFYQLGFFYCLPNFTLFILCLLAVWSSLRSLSVFIIPILFSGQAVLIGATGVKSDITVGYLGLLAWIVITFNHSKYTYLFLSLACIAGMLGTKYFAIPPAALFFVYMLYVGYRFKRFSPLGFLLTLIGAPLLWWMSSADSYLKNFQETGSFVPIDIYLSQGVGGFGSEKLYNFFKSTYQFIVVNFFSSIRFVYDLPS